MRDMDVIYVPADIIHQYNSKYITIKKCQLPLVNNSGSGHDI